MAEQPGGSIPLHYFRQPNFFQRGKLWLAAAALVLPLGWLATGWVQADRGRLRYSRGPLAVVHATWNDQCAVCHVDFTPINHRADAAELFGGFHAGDALCSKCHAGSPHSAFQVASEVGACADCHREHRGLNASLTRLPDSDCVRCHANLKQHVPPSHPAQFADVRGFTQNDHPEFRILRDRVADPGRLNFNHQVHLTPGMGGGKPNPNARIPFTLAQIPSADRERYRQLNQEKENDAQNVVQLTCASCHQLAAAPPYDQKTYMQPIQYANQCQACHPLTLEEPAGKKAWAVPHGLQPDALHELVEGALVSRYLAGQPKALVEPFEAPRPLPGKEPDREKQTARSFINSQLAAAETRLYVGHQTCGECHRFTTPGGVVTPAEVEAGTVPKFKVVPPAMPGVWFTHARFDHSAHRSMTCIACHAAAEKSADSRDVLLPGIANCLQCHKPGRARTDCTECHKYHH